LTKMPKKFLIYVYSGINKSRWQLIFSLIIYSIFFLALSNDYAQQNLPPNLISLFDSVKTEYGTQCYIGVNSRLMESLNKYQQYLVIKNYLKEYNSVKNAISTFRLNNSGALNNAAIILNMKAIFKDSLECNIVNACGIYYGVDSVNNLILTYTIVHNFVISYYINVLQLSQFDNALKEELLEYGKDWYYSKKLKSLKGAYGSIN
jgi:hypothetical protein